LKRRRSAQASHTSADNDDVVLSVRQQGTGQEAGGQQGGSPEGVPGHGKTATFDGKLAEKSQTEYNKSKYSLE
jgi:hypothetical protein